MNKYIKTINKNAKRNLIYKILAFCFAAFLFVMPSNLSALPDSDLRAIASAIGLDIGAEGVELHASVIIPTLNKSESKTAKGTGKSIAESIKALSINIGRKIEFGQCELLVIGSKINEDDFASLEYLLASGVMGAEAAVIFSQDVEEFIKNVNKIESDNANLNSFTIHFRDRIYAPATTLLDFLSALKSKAGVAYAPEIKTVKTGEDIKIDSINTAIALGYNKKSATLESSVTKGITWLDRYSSSGLVELENFEYKNLRVPKAPANLKHKRASASAKFIDGKPFYKVKLKLSLELIDGYFLLDKDYTPKELCLALSEQFENKIRAELKNCINYVTRTGVDFLGITEDFYRVCPKELKRYKGDLLNDLTIIYDLKINVK